MIVGAVCEFVSRCRLMGRFLEIPYVFLAEGICEERENNPEKVDDGDVDSNALCARVVAQRCLREYITRGNLRWVDADRERV